MKIVDPKSTFGIVGGAYKKARVTDWHLRPLPPRIRQVREIIESMKSRAGERIEVLDFKSQNRIEFEKSHQREETAVTTATLGRLLDVASSDLVLGLSLYEIVRSLRPTTCVEIGACIGVSGMFIAAGLEENGDGHLVTFEGDPNLAEIARENINRIAPGRAEVVVGPFSETVTKRVEKMASVEFAFSDQEHYLQPTLRDLNALAPKMPSGAALVFDDICWNKDMLRAWEVLSRDSRCGISATPLRFGRPARFGIWIRGETDWCATQRKTIGFPFDRPNRITSLIRRWKCSLINLLQGT